MHQLTIEDPSMQACVLKTKLLDCPFQLRNLGLQALLLSLQLAGLSTTESLAGDSVRHLAWMRHVRALPATLRLSVTAQLSELNLKKTIN